MNEFERFALALAWTESNNNREAWGDEGLACGRWCMHPAWYAEWADPAIRVGWSWDQAFRAALRRFWDEYERQGFTVAQKVQVFHLGRSAYELGERDTPYAVRFGKFWDAQTNESKA